MTDTPLEQLGLRITPELRKEIDAVRKQEAKALRRAPTLTQVVIDLLVLGLEARRQRRA